MIESPSDTEVLVVGAGPTGLALALWLAKLGIKPRIVDKAPRAGTTSRALAVQARTLEFYRQIGLAEAVVEAGRKVGTVNLWVGGKMVTQVNVHEIGLGLGPYDYMFIFPQDEHEALLEGALTKLGVKVERDTELMGFTDDGDCVRAVLRNPEGVEEMCEARYIAGCDGARSKVRETLDTGFPGGTYSQLFYVADVEASGEPVDGNLNIDLDTADFLAVFPLKADGHVRLVGAVSDERAQHPDTLAFEDVSHQAIDHMKIVVSKVNWFSTYHVHHRVTNHFRKGRAFLLGDAAHIHSPAGGQGMNTGIGDAVNLSWKLAAVLKGRAAPALLDSYEPERIGFARRLVQTTDRAFTLASAEGKLAERIRTQLLPRIAPALTGLEPVRRFAFRTVSQMVVNYRRGPLSEGAAGDVWGGDRLPWIKLANGADNFTPLKTLDWQVHVYGEASPELSRACQSCALDLHCIPWTPAMRKTGVKQDALYLVRPDGYVALADAKGDADRLLDYLKAHGIAAL
ncbi:MAG TPA: FAD-dependent monooxygenase [Caulobacteraceae bacterium]|jgi:2-polyprenyl-6-methoxyphenol hydroxylase-like FAD-dependent oxidoreductase